MWILIRFLLKALTVVVNIEESAYTVLELIKKRHINWPSMGTQFRSPYQRLVYLSDCGSAIDDILRVTQQISLIYAYALYHEYRKQLKLFWENGEFAEMVASWENVRCKCTSHTKIVLQFLLVLTLISLYTHLYL